MAVVTIKANKAVRGSQKGSTELHEKANARAARLCASCEEPVLVVYGEAGASIYYEREQAPARAPRRDV